MGDFRFGRYPENIQVKRFWGARALFNLKTSYQIDIPYDRKSFEGERENSQDFINWINKEFFEKLTKETNAKLYNNQDKIICIKSEDGKYQGEASCQGSYGYLYIGCWENA